MENHVAMSLADVAARVRAIQAGQDRRAATAAAETTQPAAVVAEVGPKPKATGPRRYWLAQN
jgi:hypothetical protein